MKFILWILDNKEWIFSGIGVTAAAAVFAVVKKLINEKISEDKKENVKGRVIIKQRKNIYIFVTGYNDDKPFSFDYRRSTPIDFVSWQKKIKSGGKIILVFDYIRDTEKSMKFKGLNVGAEIELSVGLKQINEIGEIIETMLNKALTEMVIWRNVNDFKLLVENIVNICFLFARPMKKNLKPVKVYYDNKKFVFDITEEEYENVLVKTIKDVRTGRALSFRTFMETVNDKTILEREIIPLYLKINALKEQEKGMKIEVEDFFYWNVSLGER